MSGYKIVIEKPAAKFIRKLPRQDQERVLKAIYRLPIDGERDIKPLKGHPGLLRLCVGQYRIIYTVDNGDLVVYVIDAGNRGQVYNDY